MRTIIAGCRWIRDYDLLCRVVEKSGFNISKVRCGMAKGVDMLGHRWALEHGIPIEEYPANWDKHKKAAGPIRNREMLNGVREGGDPDSIPEPAEALIAIWDKKSRGTKDMISLALENGLKVFVFIIDTL